MFAYDYVYQHFEITILLVFAKNGAAMGED